MRETNYYEAHHDYKTAHVSNDDRDAEHELSEIDVEALQKSQHLQSVQLWQVNIRAWLNCAGVGFGTYLERQ